MTCGNALDMGRVEARLTRCVARRSDMYQVQDLVCARCGRVSDSLLVSTCECSGDLRARITPHDWLRFVGVFAGIARAYRFQWLAEVCEKLSQ